MTVVATIIAIAHAEVLAVMRQGWAEVVAAAVVVAASTVHVPAVSAAIGGIEVRTSEVEVVAMRVAGIDAEVPETVAPVERTIEIGCGTEGFPLPAVEYIAEVEVTALPVETIDVVVAGDTP